MKTTAKAVAKAMDVEESDEYVAPKPCLHLDEKQYEGIGNLKLDQEVTLTVKGKVTSVSRERYSKDQKKTAEIEIQSIETEEKD